MGANGFAYWLDDATHWMPLPEAPTPPASDAANQEG